MAQWTDLLPDGVSKPIVIAITHPAAWRADKTADGASKAQANQLASDQGYLNDRSKFAKSLGADHVTVLSIQQGNSLDITVYVPSTVTGDVNTVAGKVMSWFWGSALGKIYSAAGQRNGAPAVPSGKGQQYTNIKDIAHLKQNVADDGYTHTKGHCACH